MAGSNINQNTFLHGELDPATHGATDSELYNHGLAICKNTYIQQTGSLFRRPGSQTIWIYSDETKHYLRKFFTVYDNTTGNSCLIALSLKRIELFSLFSGLLYSTDLSFFDIETWNRGFSVQVIQGNNYLFCDKGIYNIVIQYDMIWSVQKMNNIISPQTLPNANKDSYLTISTFSDERYEALITFVHDDDIPDMSEQYLTFFVDKKKAELRNHINNMINNDDLMTIDVTYFVVCKIVGRASNKDNTIRVRFMPKLSSFTSFETFRSFETERIYRYTKPIGDINTRKGCFHKGRLWILDDKRRNVYATSLNSSLDSGYLDFSRGLDDTAGLVYNFSENIGDFLWIASSDQGVFVATSAGIYVADSPIITASNLNFRLFSNVIPSAIPPLIVNSSIFFIDITGKQIHEIAKDEISGAVKTYPVGMLSQHLLNPGVVSIAYSAYPASLLCCVLQNGTFLFMGYNKSSDIYAWTRHELGGQNAHVNSVGVYKYKGHDFFIMDVTRALHDGTIRRSIEYISNDFSLAPSDKYEFNYLDSSCSSSKVAQITGLRMGISPSFQFNVSPFYDIRDTLLLLTSSDDNNPKLPLITSHWELQSDNKSLFNISVDLSHSSLHQQIKPMGEMYQLLKVPTDVHIAKNGNVFMYIRGPFLLDQTPIIITFSSWPHGKETFVSTDGDVKKFLLKYVRENSGYFIYQLYTAKGAVKFRADQDYQFTINSSDRNPNNISGIWYSLGKGIFQPGQNTIINYKMINTHKVNNTVGIKNQCTLTDTIPYGFIAKFINLNANKKIGAVASSNILYTSYNRYVMPNNYGDIILIDDITEENDIEKVQLIVRTKHENALKVINCSQGKISETRTIPTQDVVEQLYRVKLDGSYKYIIISPTAIYKAKAGVVGWEKVLNLEAGEQVIRVCNNSLICTTHYVYVIERYALKRIPHPLNKAIRCACIDTQTKSLWIGGSSGALLYICMNNDYKKSYHVKHNRNFSIEAIYLTGRYVNCLSAYGEVFQLNITSAPQINSNLLTATIADRRLHRSSGLSEAQFYYFEDKIFMIGERECVCEICPGNDIFIAQKKSPILIKDIKSFDKLNNIQIKPIDNTYDANANKGIISIPARVETERYVYDTTLVGNGNIYFKTYSINNLPQFFNETVQVTCDGLEISEKVVTKDHVYVPDGGYVLRCGYGYAQEIVTLDLSGGSVKGSSVGLIARQFTLCLRVLCSSAGKYSADGLRWYSIPYNKMLTNVHKQGQVYSGIIKMTMPNGVADINTRVLHLYNKKAEPLNILSITRDTYVSDN